MRHSLRHTTYAKGGKISIRNYLVVSVLLDAAWRRHRVNVFDILIPGHDTKSKTHKEQKRKQNVRRKR